MALDDLMKTLNVDARLKDEFWQKVDTCYQYLFSSEFLSQFCDEFLRKAGEQLEENVLRVYFDDSINFGHQAHTVLLLTRILQETTFNGTVELISDGFPDKSFAVLLPDYNPEGFTLYGRKVSVVETSSISTFAKLGICGGMDGDSDWFGDVCVRMRVEYLICLQPYGWNVPNFWVNCTDLAPTVRGILSVSDALVYYNEEMRAPLSDEAWEKLNNCYPDRVAVLNLAKQLLEGHERVCIWPVYGLHVFQTIEAVVACPQMDMLTLALTGIKCILDCPLEKPVVMTVFNDLQRVPWAELITALIEVPSEQRKDNLAECILRYLDGTSEDKKKKIQADGAAALLINAIEELLGHDLDGPLAAVHLLSAGEDININELLPGNLYIYPMGPVPRPVYEQMFLFSGFPPFFEGKGTASLAFQTHKPFLQTSYHGCSDNYPICSEDAGSCTVSKWMTEVLKVFQRGLEQYIPDFCGPKAPSLIVSWKNIISIFKAYFRSEWEPEDQRAKEVYQYFQSLSAWVDAPYNDKLKLGLIAMAVEEGEFQLDFSKGNALDWRTLEGVYQLFQDAAEHGAADLSALMPGSTLAAYTAALNGGRGFQLQVEPGSVTAEEKDGALTAVRVENAEWMFSGERFSGGLTFTMSGYALLSELAGGTGQASFFSTLPWLRLEDAGIRLRFEEGLLPLAWVVTGRLEGTELLVEIDAGPGPGRYITGTFPKPVGAMEPFFALAGGVNFVDSLPSPLCALSGFGLKQAQLWLDETTGKISAMQFSIESDQPWQFYEGVDLSFAPLVEVLVQNPQDLQNRQVSFEIGGTLKIGGGTVTVTGRAPDFSLDAWLADGKIDLTEAARLFGLDLPLKSSIDRLNIMVYPAQRLYLTEISLESSWDFFGLFTVTGIAVQARSSAGAASVGLSGSLRFLPDSENPLDLAAGAVYHDGQWSFNAVQAVAQDVSLSDVLAQYTGRRLALNRGGEEDVALCRVAVGYTTGSEDFYISAGLSKPWEIPFLDLAVEANALVGRRSSAYYARIEAMVEWQHIPLTVWYDYSEDGPYSHSFGLTWDVLSGIIVKESGTGEWVGTLTVAPGETLGGIVEKMVAWATGAPFGLEAPWNMLDKIPLPACSLVYHFGSKSVSLTANVGPIELGFATITGISLSYRSGQKNPADNGVMVSLEGSFIWNTGDGAVGDQSHLGPWNAAEPGSAPAPGGQGGKYVDLRLLALGQRTRIFDRPVQNVQDAIAQLYALTPPEEGSLPPVRYAPGSGWLIGADLGILRENEGTGYLVSLQMIFNDPDFYALRVRLDGAAAKVFKGLDFQVLYRKISETVGVFQAEIVLPDRMRYLSIGAYSLTLPAFGIAVYTNGDFQIDAGFPWGGDFSRSFSIEGIISPGIPFTGAAGFYFGKLSSATAGGLVPAADNGLFNPVLAFGFGLQIGVGKSIHYGILSGGFQVTVYGILEGVLAKWNPYEAAEASDNNLQSSYFFSVHGTVGITGRLYGQIDFCIIKAAVNIAIDVHVDFLFGSYQPTALTLSASVEASASLTLNLGLFKIHISFSFSVRVKETLTISTSGNAPWRTVAANRNGILYGRNRMRALHTGAPAVTLDHELLPSKEKKVLRAFLTAAPTAAADEWDEKAEAVACLTVLMTLDASEDCFGALCDAVARWCVCCALGKDLAAEDVDAAILSEDLAAAAAQALKAVGESLSPLSAEQIDKLLSGQFRVRIASQDCIDGMDGQELDGTFFPIPPALRMYTRQAEDAVDYTFGSYNTLPDTALDNFRKLFDQLAVQFENGRETRRCAAGETELSAASWVFSDYFLLLARQMVRALRDALRSLRFPVDAHTSAQDVLDWVKERRGEEPEAYRLYDLFTANQDHLLAPGIRLWAAGEEHETAEGDTLALLAGRLGVGIEALTNDGDGAKNAALRGIFDTKTDEYLDLPHLGSFRVAELLAQARRTGIYQTLSGMVSRYYLHGLRLPTEGIRPKAGNGMWVRDGNLPKEAGLFALTGQLVPVPLPIESTFSLCFAREPDAPDWLELPNGYTVTVEPGGADAKRLETLADFLKKGALPLPCSRLEEDTFRPAAWAFAAPAALGDGRKLWMLPAALLKLDAPGFRPVLSLSLERYDEASGGHRSVPLNTFQYVALVTFRVRRAIGKGLYPVFCSGAQTPRRLEQMLESLGPQPAALQLLCHSGDGYRVLDRGIVDLVQTDLSTESHPPVAENQAKPGTADLLMLLWQALVTNNGGTCLYYWEEDAGLPEEIFSQSGDAELAFLFPQASGGQLPAWCDCLVSSEDIPAGMTLNARAAEQPHTVSYAGESPAALQRYHLTSLTSLLRRNKGLIVQAESVWQVCHALYRAAETAAPGLTPDGIARYFSVSPSELQAENLWKKNWKEPFREGDLVLLPPFSVKARAGETLESLAQRCGVQPLTLLWQNREQTGRFQADQELTLDACPGSCFSSLVPGCLAEAFQREEPGEVPDVPNGSDDYARAMLSNSATLLRYRVEKTPWFDASSASSVPLSPDKDWRYAVSFPAASYAGKNGYEVIGSAVRLRYEWIDLYGNRIKTDPAALESTRLIGYTDSLLPISRWPSFTAAWRLSGDEAHPVFELSLRFSPERYHVSGPEGMDEAGQDLTLLRTAYAQITDPNCTALTLRTSLLGSGGTGFPADQCARLADYLLAVREFLKTRAAGQSAQAPEQALVLCFHLEPAELCTDRLFSVEASVEITRSAPPMAGYEEVDQIVQAECPIAPDTGDLTAFARSFETAFPQVSLAAAANDAGKGLWALRRECRAGDGGLYFDIPKEQPVLYAPRPISNRLESRSGVRVYRYTPGQVLSEQDIEVRSFQNADLNVWLRELVDAMDSVFVPETAAAVRRMDDSRQEALYPVLADARRALAGALSTLLVPLYEGQQPIAAETARENFRQKLLSRLNEFYEVRAILLYHTEIRSGLAGAIRPRLYGELDYETRENAAGVSLASARLPLESGSEQFLAAALQGPGIVRGGEGEILPSLTLGAVWRPSHVEYDIRRPEGFGGYEDSGWLSLLLPEQYRRTLEQTLVPLPLASFPQTPLLSGQSCESGESLWMWRYCFTYSLDVHYPQNVLHCTVRFNETGENYRAGTDKLFESLARCHMACGSLSRDISANAAKAADAGGAASIFDAALRSLVLVSGETAEALRSEAIAGHVRNDGPGAIHFTIREGVGTQGELLVFVEGAEGIEVQVSPEQYAAEPVENGVWHYRDRQTGALLPASEGQTAALRTVLLPPVNLFVSQSAKASLFAEQNRGLVPDRELSEYFLFTTGETTFPEPCFPVKTVTEETDMTACLGRPGTIREHLDAFFATLPDETDALFQIQASYRRRLLNGVPDFPLAETPLFLQTPIAVTKKELSSRKAAWADALSGWRREHFGEVSWSEDEDIHLEITILSTLTKNPSPMLTIKHAVLPGRMLKP